MRLKESNLYLQKFKKDLSDRQKAQSNKAIEAQNKRGFAQNKPGSQPKKDEIPSEAQTSNEAAYQLKKVN